MSITRHAALEKIRSQRLQMTACLIEQGVGHSGEFEDRISSHHEDIDFWAATADRQTVAQFFAKLGAVRLARTSRKAWLNHDVFLVSCSDGSLLIDVKFGNLKVGSLTLMGEADLLASLNGDKQFMGAARIVDVLLRRLARGKPVDDLRLEIARSAWQRMTPAARESTISGFTQRFGAQTTDGISDLLEGREPALLVQQALRMQVLGSHMSGFGSIKMALSKVVSNAVGMLTRRSRPFGQYQLGSLVVISGTDGVGKSTTLENVVNDLTDHGFRCKAFYLGRGRGNLRGVVALREIVSRGVKNDDAQKDVYRLPAVNKLASWLYAFEYFLRTIKPRFFARILGYAVICDRYCYDIALVPGASTRAIGLARLLCPTPDMNVLLYAPPIVILERKAERGLAEIETQQTILMQIIDGAYARQVSLHIDTSKIGVAATRQKIVNAIYQLSARDYE